jgi:tetratricopeptide (TPR) repeat protein
MSIALHEQRWADLVHILEQSLQMPGIVQNKRKRELSGAYFLFLKANDKAREFAPNPGWTLLFDAILTPEAALPAMRQAAAASEFKLLHYFLALNLAYLGRCEEVMEVQADDDWQGRPIWGTGAGGILGTMPQYLIAAWCLQQLEQPQEARRLLQRLEAYIDEAVINGMPPSYQTARPHIRLLLGDEDGAIALIERSLEHGRLGWVDLEYPWIGQLEEREDYQAIRARLYDEINAERAKLGMAPAAP